ncbi:MAG TPA: type II toxin-antitoxin system Phd/YefM family antitoxin [Acidimicrobiales bacterium]|nr:type II toxin-antitoxin system Phd/YefM family antitoxin [Acidimicrobiales bacterium]
MLTTFTVSQARAALPQLLDRVGAGEELTITRHGKAVAVLVAPDALRSRRADHAIAEAGAIRDAMERARRAPLPAHPAISQERGDALLEEIRSGRSSR